MLVKNPFFRRLRLYGFGFILGLLMVKFMFNDRTICKTPGSIKREELKKQHREFSTLAQCNLACFGLDTSKLDLIFEGGKIDFDLSNPQAKPCPTYLLLGKAVDQKITMLCEA